MKKNLKFFAFSVLALSLGLVSCKKDKDVVAPEQNQGEPTLVTFSISQSAPGTYAAPANAHQATAAEKAVNNAHVYIFKADGSFVKDEAVSLTSAGGNDKTAAVKLQTGENYYIYAAVNIPSTHTVGTITNRADFVKSVVNVNTVADITTGTTGFFMTNINDNPQSVPAGGDALNPKTVSLSVGRAVSKTNVEYNESNAIQPASGKLTNVKYQVINNYNKMHFMPNFVGSQVQGILWAIEDPATSSAPALPANVVLPTGTATDVNYTRTAWVDVTPDNGAGVEAGGNEYLYAVVNTQAKPMRAASVAVLLKGTFEPTTVYTLTNASGGPAPAPVVAATSEVSTSYTVGSTFSYLKFDDGTASRFYDRLLTLADVNDVKAAEGYPSSSAVATIIEHQNAESYYTIWLGEKSLPTPTEKFSTLRNKLYWVEVTQILNAGNGTNEIPAEIAPIMGETHINFSIHVKDWTVVDISEAAGAI